MSSRRFALAALPVVIALLVGCFGGSDGGPQGQHFVFNNGAEPEFLDPGKASGSSGIRLISQLFEGLTTLDPETLEPLPGAAERWEVSDDGLTYTFHLRDGLRWSDGTPLSAEDFRWSWIRVLTPATGAKYADQLYLIENGEALHSGELDDPEKLGVEAPDPRTLIVHLENPCGYFLELTAFATYMPVPRAAVEDHGDRWTFTGNMVSNGPFELDRWSERDRIVLQRNERYWDASNVRLEKVTALPHEDQNSAYQKFVSGAIHWMDTVPAGKLEEAQRRPDFYTCAFLDSYYYRFNCSEPPFDEAAVRQAFSRSIDRTAITRDITRLGETPATWFVPKMPSYQPVEGLAYDPEAARALLADAGYEDPATFPQVDILYNESDLHRRIAEAIAQQWRENLGVAVGTQPMEWKSYLKEMDALNYQICRSGWIGDYQDPYTFLSCFISDGGNNRTGWSSERYDDLLQQSQRSSEPEQRRALYRELERIIVKEQLPIAPIFIYVNKGLISPKVRGFTPNRRDLLFCKHLWIEN